MIRIAYMKSIFTLFALCLLSTPVFAQDCNGTYEEGMALLKKRTQSAVKEAVRKFKSAQLCYKVNRNQDGVQNCEKQLATCQQILNYYTRQAARITTEEELTFPASGGKQTLPIKSRQAWSFTGSHDWCSAQKEDDGLAISVEPNPTPVRRSQTVTLKWKNGQQLVKITQERSELQFSVSENDIYFTANDQEKRVEVSANVDWTVDQSTIPEWCNLRTDKDAVYLTLTPNNTAEQRRAAITLHAETKKEIIRIVQDMENFRILTGSNSDTLSFLRNGGKRSLGIEYTVHKNSSEWEVESYPNWCKASKESDNLLQLECDKNKTKMDRSGVIRLRKGQRIISLTVKQSTKNESLKQRLFGK